ncbi:MAG: efflux RND transporter periplasmic adaptor subunit [Planctomycetes bacterium]|nr:efflux RND transporter periplasmic adaptor subunit [Planctomycetota bacterium]MBI3833417.1 efflux RND transporter periplasmic adaptor subunit [Planctomycetota bacterium]
MMTVDTKQPTPQKHVTVLGRLWWFIEILNVRLRFIFLMVLVGFVVGYWEDITNHIDRWRRPETAPDVVAAQEIEYYCAMHPNIIRSEPGKCPICGMPLVKRAKTSHGELPEGVLARQQLTPLKVRMGRISTTPAEYRLLAREIRTVGIVAYDETKRAFIASRIKGRVDKLLVNYVGQYVHQGDPLLSIYSPELLTAQQELIVAARRSGATEKADDFERQTKQSLIEASRQKLLLWGITEEQIQEILQRGTPQTHLDIYSPIAGFVTEKKTLEGHYVMEGDDLYTIANLSNVWMEAKVFEDEAGGVAVGTAVEVISSAYPNEVFAGKITFIAYVVDPATRTVSARVEIANPDLKLKPGMYAQAVIRVPVGTVTELASAPTAQEGEAPVGTTPLDTSALVHAYSAAIAPFVNNESEPVAIQSLVDEAQKLASGGQGTPFDRARAIADTAKQLAGKNLAEQRDILKKISEQLIELVRASAPSGLKLFVAHCPMVNADWLQESPKIGNPFLGKEMPSCGEITGTIEASAVTDSEQFATGYYCPVYPDRLFNKPELCPIDKFPLRLAKVEKTLSVPLSAVINTGTRKVVYRETDPGTFDMLEVQIGKRAGEFYPVLAGLKPGDHVATAGAFLVDAENRLNPAASAQFFGASGGPQQAPSGGAHKH